MQRGLCCRLCCRLVTASHKESASSCSLVTERLRGNRREWTDPTGQQKPQRRYRLPTQFLTALSAFKCCDTTAITSGSAGAR